MYKILKEFLEYIIFKKLSVYWVVERAGHFLKFWAMPGKISDQNAPGPSPRIRTPGVVIVQPE